MSSHYKHIINGNGTDLTISDDKYISVGRDGYDIMLRCKDTVIGFESLEQLVEAIAKEKVPYYHNDTENKTYVYGKDEATTKGFERKQLPFEITDSSLMNFYHGEDYEGGTLFDGYYGNVNIQADVCFNDFQVCFNVDNETHDYILNENEKILFLIALKNSRDTIEQDDECYDKYYWEDFTYSLKAKNNDLYNKYMTALKESRTPRKETIEQDEPER